ncbi:MAG: DUF6183 family protein [Actinomycetota bacterium]
MMPDPSVTEAVEAGDMNALLRIVDGYAASRRWDDLLDVADLCEEAVERGKQLWPIAAHIDYRIALEAPGERAAEVLESDLARFTLGPLTEVAASTHPWSELAPYIDTPVAAAYVAQERVLRGEDLRGDRRAHAEVLELPLKVLDWEPTYPPATYRADVVEVAEPWTPKAPLRVIEPGDAEELDEHELTAALLELVQPWTTESNGAARAVVVEGDAAAAVGSIAFGAVRMGELRLDEALQRMAWAAASGGAHGRRRGGALGRSLTWHTASVLADLDWPPEPAELHQALDAFRWFRWDEGAAEEGWVLRLGVADPEHGWSAAIAATDLLEDETKDR